jgi:hypothetical protein
MNLRSVELRAGNERERNKDSGLIDWTKSKYVAYLFDFLLLRDVLKHILTLELGFVGYEGLRCQPFKHSDTKGVHIIVQLHGGNSKTLKTLFFLSNAAEARKTV